MQKTYTVVMIIIWQDVAEANLLLGHITNTYVVIITIIIVFLVA